MSGKDDEGAGAAGSASAATEGTGAAGSAAAEPGPAKGAGDVGSAGGEVLGEPGTADASIATGAASAASTEASVEAPATPAPAAVAPEAPADPATSEAGVTPATDTATPIADTEPAAGAAGAPGTTPPEPAAAPLTEEERKRAVAFEALKVRLRERMDILVENTADDTEKENSRIHAQNARVILYNMGVSRQGIREFEEKELRKRQSEISTNTPANASTAQVSVNSLIIEADTARADSIERLKNNLAAASANLFSARYNEEYYTRKAEKEDKAKNTATAQRSSKDKGAAEKVRAEMIVALRNEGVSEEEILKIQNQGFEFSRSQQVGFAHSLDNQSELPEITNLFSTLSSEAQAEHDKEVARVGEAKKAAQESAKSKLDDAIMERFTSSIHDGKVSLRGISEARAEMQKAGMTPDEILAFEKSCIEKADKELGGYYRENHEGNERQVAAANKARLEFLASAEKAAQIQTGGASAPAAPSPGSSPTPVDATNAPLQASSDPVTPVPPPAPDTPTAAASSADAPEAAAPATAASPAAASSTGTPDASPPPATSAPAATSPDKDEEQERDPSWFAQFERDSSSLEDIKNLSKKARSKDPALGQKTLRGTIEKGLDKDGNKITKNIFNDGETHVELTYKKRSAGPYKNIRDVDIEVKQAPAIVSLAATDSAGRKLNGKSLVIEYDKDGKAVGSNIDLRLAKFDDRMTPPVAYIEDKNGEKIILPINGDKVKALKREIDQHKAKYKKKDRKVAKEKDAETPSSGVDKAALAAAAAKKPDDKTREDLVVELTALQYEMLEATAKKAVDPSKENTEALTKADAEYDKYYQANRNNAEYAKAAEQAKKAAKDAIKLAALKELRAAQKEEMEAAAKGDADAQKKAAKKVDLAAEKFKSSGAKQEDLDKAVASNKKEILGEFGREEFAEACAGRDGKEARKKQGVAMYLISADPEGQKAARHEAIREIMGECIREEMAEKAEGKVGIDARKKLSTASAMTEDKNADPPPVQSPNQAQEEAEALRIHAIKAELLRETNKELEAKIEGKDAGDAVLAQQNLREKLQENGVSEDKSREIQHQARLHVISHNMRKAPDDASRDKVKGAAVQILGSKAPRSIVGPGLEATVAGRSGEYQVRMTDTVAPSSTPQGKTGGQQAGVVI